MKTSNIADLSVIGALLRVCIPSKMQIYENINYGTISSR
jgi:hypothetical protein